MKWKDEGLGRSSIYFQTEIVEGKYVRLKSYFNAEDPYLILGDFYNEQDAEAFAGLWTFSNTFIKFCQMKDLLHEYRKTRDQLERAQRLRLEMSVEPALEVFWVEPVWERITESLDRRIWDLENFLLYLQKKVDYELDRFPYKVHFRDHE